MKESGLLEKEALAFIKAKIESVPHLEALLLVWRTRPRTWHAPELAARLYIEVDASAQLLRDLAQQHLLTSVPSEDVSFLYEGSPERDQLMTGVEEVYRTQLVRVSTMIHSKASPAVRDFARAFRFTKDRP